MSKLKQTRIPMMVDEQNELIPDIPYKYVLKRVNDGLTKRDNSIVFVLWNEDGTYKQTSQTPCVGASLMLGARLSYTWLTTTITNIISESEDRIVFTTRNSTYVLEIDKGL